MRLFKIILVSIFIVNSSTYGMPYSNSKTNPLGVFSNPKNSTALVSVAVGLASVAWLVNSNEDDKYQKKLDKYFQEDLEMFDDLKKNVKNMSLREVAEKLQTEYHLLIKSNHGLPLFHKSKYLVNSKHGYQGFKESKNSFHHPLSVYFLFYSYFDKSKNLVMSKNNDPSTLESSNDVLDEELADNLEFWVKSLVRRTLKYKNKNFEDTDERMLEDIFDISSEFYHDGDYGKLFFTRLINKRYLTNSNKDKFNFLFFRSFQRDTEEFIKVKKLIVE
jgi:hypothetical protein